MLKAAFWICVLVIALPFATGSSSNMPADYDAEPVRLGEVVSMVQTTASDVMRLCEREPDACDTGQRIVWNTRIAAGELAGKAQSWLDGSEGEGAEGSEPAYDGR